MQLDDSNEILRKFQHILTISHSIHVSSQPADAIVGMFIEHQNKVRMTGVSMCINGCVYKILYSNISYILHSQALMHEDHFHLFSLVCEIDGQRSAS